VAAPEPGGPGWQNAQSQWLEPAVAALKSGRLNQLLLSAANRRCTLTRAGLRRFWRRSRPWSEHFASAPWK
jgi:hypothetical protein